MEGRVYRINRAMERSVFIDRGYPVRMREMLSGMDLDAKAEHLYLADRLAGQILRYPIQADGTAGRPEVMASGLVALRSIAVDDEGGLFASIDFPIIVRIDRDKKQRSYVITGCQDFLIGRIALGRAGTDKNSLYVPTNTGIVKLDLSEEMGH
jgi:sugar lactone lactonase YvrE